MPELTADQLARAPEEAARRAKLRRGAWWKTRRHGARVRILAVEGLRVRYSCARSYRNPKGRGELEMFQFLMTYTPADAVPS